MKPHLILLIFVAALMTGCGPMVKEVDYKQARLVPEDVRPRPIKFTGLKLLLPPGMEIGYETYGGQFCTLPRYPVNRSVLKKAIDRKYLKLAFEEALEANGYDVVDSIDLLFAPEDEEQRAEYSVGGKLVDVAVDMCTKDPKIGLVFFTWRPGQKGEMYVGIDWSIYDQLRRHVVYKKRTEGFARRRLPNKEGLTLMLQDAFEMAVHNLAADQEFYDLIFHGIKPSKNYSGFAEREEKFGSRPRIFDPLEEVAITDKPLSRQPFKKEAQEKRKVAVMVQKTGHGSGFFISDQGHILTNAHVVGDSHRTRIVTADKKRLIAEVLRIDKVRDIALLKVEEMPENIDITTLPIRTKKLSVGEDIYAIGVPKDYRAFQTTLTKGIVSAHRRYNTEGVRLNYIQGDVEIHPGNSGGPLLDEYGNIVGVSVRGYQHKKLGVGLNLFIPIAEALSVLDITIDGQSIHIEEEGIQIDGFEGEEVERPYIPEELLQ